MNNRTQDVTMDSIPKRVLKSIVTAALVLGLSPILTVLPVRDAYADSTEATVATLAELNTAIANSSISTINLGADIDLDSSTVYFNADRYINFYLNGHSLISSATHALEVSKGTIYIYGQGSPDPGLIKSTTGYAVYASPEAAQVTLVVRGGTYDGAIAGVLLESGSDSSYYINVDLDGGVFKGGSYSFVNNGQTENIIASTGSQACFNNRIKKTDASALYIGAGYYAYNTVLNSKDEVTDTYTITNDRVFLPKSVKYQGYTYNYVIDYSRDGNAAKIGTTEYATFDEAYDAAEEGQTITLLVDCTTTTKLKKNVTYVPKTTSGACQDLTANDISAGTFELTVYACGEISGGTFAAYQYLYGGDEPLLLGRTATITGGTFAGYVMYFSEISGGTFSGDVQSVTEISGGTFNYTARGVNSITDGTFNGTVNGYGYTTISGGTFNGSIESIPSKGISGGTFSTDPTAYVADGCTVEKSAAEPYKWTVIPNGKASVTTGGTTTYYDTFADALAAAKGTSTVKLYDNVDLDSSSITISDGRNLTLDLNGYTILTEAQDAIYLGNGTLTINDSYTGSDRIGTISAAKNGIYVGYNENGNTLTVNAGTIQGAGTGAGVSINGPGTFTFNGGTFAGGQYSIYDKSGSSDATTIAITGGYYNGPIAKNSTSTLSFDGGYFTTNTIKDSTSLEATDTYTVTLGKMFIAQSNVVDEVTYNYVVTPLTADNAAASITKNNVTTYYASLDDAYTAASVGDTITLLQDCTTTTTLAKDITYEAAIDPDSSQPIYWLNANDISAGTFNVRVVALGTISGGTFNHFIYGRSVDSEGIATDFTKAATGNITGGTFNSYVWYMDEISGGTFNDSGEIRNPQLISGGTFDCGVQYAVTISGGTFNKHIDGVNYRYVDGEQVAFSFTTITGGTFKSSYAGIVSITGGTFSTDPTQYVASYCTVTKSDTAPYIWTVESHAVASITKNDTTTYYTSLAEAIEAAASGDTIDLTKSFTESPSYWQITKNITIDFHGYTLTSASDYGFHVQLDSGAVTFKNGTYNNTEGYGFYFYSGDLNFVNQTVTTGKQNAIYVVNNGTSTITIDKDSVIQTPNATDSYVSTIQTSESSSEVILNVYGKVLNGTNGGIAIDTHVDKTTHTDTINIYDGAEVKSAAGTALKLFAKSSTNISGGTVEGGVVAITMMSGDLNISGGIVKSTGEHEAIFIGSSSYCYGNINIAISGSPEITSAKNYAISERLTDGATATTVTSLSITGGKFSSGASMSSDISISTELAATSAGAGFISGGIYSKTLPSALIASGKAVVTNEDASTSAAYPFAIGEVSDVASITKGDPATTTKYASLADAVAAATSGDTIVLLADSSEDFTLPLGVTFDASGDGITYSGTVGAPTHYEATAQDGVYTVAVKSTCVAAIGDTEYSTLEAAIAAAVAGKTVTLYQSVEISGELTVDKAISIVGVPTGDTNPQIKFTGDGDSNGNHRGIKLGANVTLQNLDIWNASTAGYSRAVSVTASDITVAIDTCNIKSGHSAVRVNSGISGVTVTIDNSKLDAFCGMQIWAADSTFTLNDTTVNAESTSNGVGNSYGAIVFDCNYGSDFAQNCTVNLNNCDVTAKQSGTAQFVAILFQNDAADNKVVIDGGTFATAEDNFVCDDGSNNYVLYRETTADPDYDDGAFTKTTGVTYSSKEYTQLASGQPYFFKVGDKYYQFIEDAIDATTADNKTITLSHWTEGIGSVICIDEGDIILDLNGLTMDYVDFEVESPAHLTIIDSSTDDGAVRLYYGLNDISGNVEIKGGTYSRDISALVPAGYIVTPVEVSGFDYSWYKVTKAPVSLTVNGESTYYASLADALAAVPTDNSETTITLTGDITIDEALTIASNQNVVLNLAGYTITTAVSQAITNQGSLKVAGNGEIITSSDSVIYNDNGYLVIENGTFTSSLAPETKGTSAVIKINGSLAKLFVNGGTFECEDNMSVLRAETGAAITVAAGKFNGECATKDDTSSVVISGGYFTLHPSASYVADGKTVINTPASAERNECYLYTIGEQNTTKYTVETYSNESLCQGGGSYVDGVLATVSVEPKDDYTFDGWYKTTDGTTATGDKFSSDLTYSIPVRADLADAQGKIKLIAVFVADSSVTTKDLTVTGGNAKFSTNYEKTGTISNGNKSSIKFGSKVTLTATDEGNFIGWYDSSNNKVSGAEDYTFILNENVTLTAKYAAPGTSQAVVSYKTEIKNPSGEVLTNTFLQAKEYSTDSTAENYVATAASEQPVVPSYLGYTFTGYTITVNGAQRTVSADEQGKVGTSDLANAIKDANNQSTVTVTADYVKDTRTFKIKLHFMDGPEEIANAIILNTEYTYGDAIKVWAGSEDTFAGTAYELASYTYAGNTYTGVDSITIRPATYPDSGIIDVYANYVPAGSTISKTASAFVEGVKAITENGTAKTKIIMSYSVPTEWSVTGVGFVMSSSEANPTTESYTAKASSAKLIGKNTGTYTININQTNYIDVTDVTNPSAVDIYVRGYITYEYTDANGTHTNTVYTSYNNGANAFNWADLGGDFSKVNAS